MLSAYQDKKMQIELVHPAIPLCTAWDELLTDCNTVGKFCSRIDRFAGKIRETPSEQVSSYYQFGRNEDNKDKPWTTVARDASNKFKGDVFEVFSELMIRLSPLDDRIGIHDYQIITVGDTGVDGHGVGRDGLPVTVQIKYRQWSKSLDVVESHLHNFSLTSRNKFGVDTNRSGSMLLITCGKEVHWDTMARFTAMRCISRDASNRCLRGSQPHTIDSLFSLKTIVDGVELFWGTFRNQLGVA